MSHQYAPTYVTGHSSAIFGDVYHSHVNAENPAAETHEELQRRRQILADWFSPADFADQQTDQLSRRRKGTGQWFLTHPSYQRWRDDPGATLLCPGIPGAGKSVMAASIVDNIQRLFQENNDVAVIYFYCNFRRQAEQDFPHMLAVLIRQLFQEQAELPAAVQALYTKHRDRKTRPSIEDLRSVLQELAALYARIFVVIDALDECDNVDQARDQLLDELLFLQNENEQRTNVLVTTRFIPDVMQSFLQCTQLEIRARDEDIGIYLDSRMAGPPRFISRDASLRAKIKSQIIEAADGMFLLARLHFDSLREAITPRALERALTKLEKGSGALNTVYGDVLYRIDHQLDGWRSLARKVLLWISHAKRELTIEELQEAVSIEPGWEDIDRDMDISDEELIVSVCHGLVEIDRESRVARLVHHTTQTYLETVRHEWHPAGHVEIIRACLAYLKMKALDHDKCRWRMDFSLLMRRYRLLLYAGKNWGYHAQKADHDQVQVEIMEFLLDPGYLRFASQIAYSESPGKWVMDKYISFHSELSAMHICAKFGLGQILLDLVNQGEDPNAKDSEGERPLHVAVEEGQVKVVQQLLALPQVDVNARDDLKRSPLIIAVSNGSTEIVQHLLARQDVDVQRVSLYGEPVLCIAADGGHTEIIQQLLAHPDMDVNAKSARGRTALGKAADKGFADVVQLLLAHPGVDSNSKAALGDLETPVEKESLDICSLETLGSMDSHTSTHDYIRETRPEEQIYACDAVELSEKQS